MREFDQAEMSAFVMGTFLVIRAWGKNARSAVRRAYSEIRRTERLMSVFRPGSDVFRVNSSAAVRPVKVSKDTAEVLDWALFVSKMSGGAFDVTAGPISMLWKKALEEGELPSPQAVDRALETVGFEALEVDPATRRVYLNVPGASIDLGGIAKGYAADKAVEVFKDLGIDSALVDIGGNVAAVGHKEDGTPWRVGVQAPCSERGGHIGAVDVVDKAVVTSGDYEQYFELEGERYHHIIDPRTGWPAKSGLKSATVIADTGLAADSLSTAAFVLGLQEAARLATQFNVGMILVDDSGRVHRISDVAVRSAEPGVSYSTLPG